jgi:hypothetical protein
MAHSRSMVYGRYMVIYVYVYVVMMVGRRSVDGDLSPRNIMIIIKMDVW